VAVQTNTDDFQSNMIGNFNGKVRLTLQQRMAKGPISEDLCSVLSQDHGDYIQNCSSNVKS